MKVRENSGKKIQDTATGIMTIGSCCVGVIAVLEISMLYEITDSVNIAIIIPMVLAALVILLLWVVTVMIRGVGEIVEFTAETASYTEALVGQVESMTTDIEPTVKASEQADASTLSASPEDNETTDDNENMARANGQQNTTDADKKTHSQDPHLVPGTARLFQKATESEPKVGASAPDGDDVGASVPDNIISDAASSEPAVSDLYEDNLMPGDSSTSTAHLEETTQSSAVDVDKSENRSNIATCPSCGAVQKPGNRFCGECGTKLSN